MATTRSERASWTTQGAQTSAAATYAAVQNALNRSPAVQALDVEVFLQGSYANHTNTRGDSDVDIVVASSATFHYSEARLTAADRQRHQVQRIPGTVTSDAVRQAVQEALVSYFGRDRVRPKNKCLRIEKRDGYVDADVVPAQQYRLFTEYPAYGSPRWIEGIRIQPLKGSAIINYPKEHIRNGQAKNSRCNDRYKPTVRQMKRLRRKAVDAGLLSRSDAPGYLLECMVYNVPTQYFGSDAPDRLIEVVRYLHSFSAERFFSDFWSGDHIHKLFDTDPGEHNQYTAVRVIDQLWNLL